MVGQFPIIERKKSALELSMESRDWTLLYNYDSEKGICRDGKQITQEDEIIQILRENPRFQDVTIEDAAYDRDCRPIHGYKAIYAKLAPKE